MPNKKTVVPYTGTPEQEAKLQEVIQKYKGVPGGTMPVMQQAQEIFGYLPEEVQIKIAEGMEIPLEEVYGISTFYSLYDLNPKGQYKITVCLGTACYVKGSQAVLDKIVARLGCPVGSISPGRKVFRGCQPLRGRLRSGPGYDGQRRCLRPYDPRSGGRRTCQVQINERAESQYSGRGEKFRHRRRNENWHPGGGNAGTAYHHHHR